MRAEARRAVLLEVAPRLFLSHGYAATTLGDLACAAGCSRAGLSRQFATKDDLLGAVAAPFIDDVSEMLGTVSLDVDGETDRISILHSYFATLATHRNMAKVLLTDAGVRLTDAGQRVVEQQRLLVARLTGPRAPLRQQVRARCALSISHLMVGELSNVPAHRLRPPLLDAAIETLGAGHGELSPATRRPPDGAIA